MNINWIASDIIYIFPKKEIDYFFDMDATLLANSMSFSKEVAAAIRRAIPCKRIGIAIIGLEVPHAHIHLVPLNTVGDINFDKPKIRMTEKELEEIASKIRGFMN